MPRHDPCNGKPSFGGQGAAAGIGRDELSIGIVEELILPTLRAIENELYPCAGGATKSRIYAQLRELIVKKAEDGFAESSMEVKELRRS